MIRAMTDAEQLAAPDSPTRSWRRCLRRMLIIGAGLLLTALALAGWVGHRLWLSLYRTRPAPESATGLRRVSDVKTRHWVVVTAHAEATRIGAEVLERGGTAMDAVVAVQAALTLVEPQSSGIGGGAFLLYYDARTGVFKAYDGRETAPGSATPSLFLDDRGKPMSFPVALVGGRSIGVPGVVRLLAQAHARHGRLGWRELFSDTIALARKGFMVTPRLHELVESDPVLPAIAETRNYFFDSRGWALPPGSSLINTALADTLQTLAEDGPETFYTGTIAQELLAAVHGATRTTMARIVYNLALRNLGIAATGDATLPVPGGLTASDLAAYKVVEREPLCGEYRRYLVCGFPPPSSGGVALLQALKFLERFDLAKLRVDSESAIHLLIEAERLALADRDRWIADPDFAIVPTRGLLEPEYLRARGELLDPMHTRGKATPGTPPGAPGGAESGRSYELPSTSHFVVVDADGSAASMTSSIEFGFGSHVMVRGFLLNNQLTDFSFAPVSGGSAVQNAVAPGKRPRSSMSPTLVFDKETHRLVLALGSPGGSRIIGYVLRTLVGILDGGLTPQEAVSRPHVLGMNEATEVEDVGWTTSEARDDLVRALAKRGHEVTIGQQNSGLHVVQFGPETLVAGVDPRREGCAIGR